MALLLSTCSCASLFGRHAVARPACVLSCRTRCCCPSRFVSSPNDRRGNKQSFRPLVWARVVFFSAFAGSPCTVTPVLLRQNDDLNLEATPPRAPGEDFTAGVAPGVVCQRRTTDFNCPVPALRCQQNLALRPCLIIGAPSVAVRPSVRPSVPAREAQSVARRSLGSSVI